MTDQVISKETFAELSWPEQSLALLTLAAAGEEDTADFQPQVREADFGLSGRRHMRWIPGGETKDFALEDRQETDQYLFLSFKVKNNRPRRDVSISVNGETNKQSASQGYAYDNENQVFYYMCPLEEGQTSVEIAFGEGSYEISDAQAWYGSADDAGSGQAEYVDAGLELTAERGPGRQEALRQIERRLADHVHPV